MFKKRSHGIIISAITIFITVGLFALPVSAGTVPLAVCMDSCNLSPTPSNPILLYWAPYPAEMQSGQGIAWTIFDDELPLIPTGELIEYFCMYGPNACYNSIYANNGTNSLAQKQFRCAFLNPLYDSSNKTCEDGACDSITDIVTTWKVLVPVLSYPNGCPPGNEPYPMMVEHYAELTILEVYAGGGSITGCACAVYDAPPSPLGPNAIVVDSIQCISCDDFVYGGPFKLPDTGQTLSYTDTFGEDSDYSTNPPSFTINPDGVTVTDNNTELMWQREDGGMTYDWYTADMFCDNLFLGGHSDWRLPTKKELLSIADFEYSIALDQTYFPNFKWWFYWSSDDNILNPSSAWGVFFGYELVVPRDKSSHDYVRCVRGSPLVFHDYAGDISICGTVYDNATKLEWQKSGVWGILGWEEALTYCEELSLCGYDDWRLPNVKELESLTDVTRYDPAVDTVYFLYSSGPFWTSTTSNDYLPFTPNAFIVNFYAGSVESTDKNHLCGVRCVRGEGIYADNDLDGYDSSVDCDDNDPAVNPGMTEVPYNGKDDDCDPATKDDDLDNDGYGIADDCDDNDPVTYPNATEIKHDGIDQDCNGYDLTIDITKAKYGANNTLKVEATSDLGSGANLELVGHGPMIWHHKKLLWMIEVDSVGGDPGTVTVCGIEGCETAPTTSGGAPTGKEGKAKTCSDGIDNDSDGLIDCADPDCSKNKACK